MTVGTGHTWLAEALAGDPLVLSLLHLRRMLSADKLGASLRAGEHIKAEIPAAVTQAMMLHEYSRAPA